MLAKRQHGNALFSALLLTLPCTGAAQQEGLRHQHAAATDDNIFFHSVGTPREELLRAWCPPPGTVIPWNHTILRRLRQHQPQSGRRSLVLDIGAFDGSDAVALADDRGAAQRVWSFEPSPTKVAYIQNRINQSELTNRVSLHQMALSNYSGTAQFQMFKSKHMSRAMRASMAGKLGSAQDMLFNSDTLSLDEQKRLEGSAGHERETSTVVNVPVRTLDSLLVGHSASRVEERETIIPFMKVDAQGFDFRVLHGAIKAMRHGRVGVLVFEFALSLIPGGLDEAAAGLRLLKQLGADCLPCNDWTAGGKRSQTRINKPTSISDFVKLWNSSLNPFDNIVCQWAGGPADPGV